MRRAQRLVKNEFIFYKESHDHLDLLSLPNGLVTSPGKICKENVQRQKELHNFCRRDFRLRRIWLFHVVVQSGQEMYKELKLTDVHSYDVLAH